MSYMVSITLEENIFFSEEYVKLKNTRGFSKLVNNLLREHFNVKKQAVPEDLISIDDELQQINARKALLIEKKMQKEKEIKEEEERWTYIGKE